jgi:hypothetical protein
MLPSSRWIVSLMSIFVPAEKKTCHDLTEPSRRGGCRETKPYLDVWSLPGLLVIGAFVYLYAMFAIAAKVGAT